MPASPAGQRVKTPKLSRTPRGQKWTTFTRDRTVPPLPWPRIAPPTTVSDFEYVSTWQGFVYVACVIGTFADRMLAWRVSCCAKTDFGLGALEQAIHDRRPVQASGLVHHSDRGGQYVSIRYTKRLAQAGVEPSVGNAGETYPSHACEQALPGSGQCSR